VSPNAKIWNRNFQFFLTFVKMKTIKLVFPFIIFVVSQVVAQSRLEWSPDYKLQMSDFQSEGTKTGGNINSLIAGSGIEFAYTMSTYEFMFTKNFNSKVSCVFMRSSASLIATDEKTAGQLLKLSQFDFDLSELYARKLRKKLYENKGTFSDAGFFKPLYDDINKELTERMTKTNEETNLGSDETKLAALHAQVLSEIAELPDFCKSCKPPKKKKK
jgi:hypothetical protein